MARVPTILLSFIALVAVLAAPQCQVDAATAVPSTIPRQLPGIIKTMLATGDFKIFLAGLNEIVANGDAAFLQTGSYTLLVPTDKAFDILTGKIASYETMLKVVAYHILKGAYSFKQMQAAKINATFATVEGQPLYRSESVFMPVVHVREKPTAAKTLKDIATVVNDNVYVGKNIVIHAINRVLMPKL